MRDQAVDLALIFAVDLIEKVEPKDLFADPFDEDDPGQLLKPLLVSTTPDRRPGPPNPAEVHAHRLVLAGRRRSFSAAVHLARLSDAVSPVAR